MTFLAHTYNYLKDFYYERTKQNKGTTHIERLKSNIPARSHLGLSGSVSSQTLLHRELQEYLMQQSHKMNTFRRFHKYKHSQFNVLKAHNKIYRFLKAHKI